MDTGSAISSPPRTPKRRRTVSFLSHDPPPKVARTDFSHKDVDPKSSDVRSIAQKLTQSRSTPLTSNKALDKGHVRSQSAPCHERPFDSPHSRPLPSPPPSPPPSPTNLVSDRKARNANWIALVQKQSEAVLRRFQLPLHPTPRPPPSPQRTIGSPVILSSRSVRPPSSPVVPMDAEFGSPPRPNKAVPDLMTLLTRSPSPPLISNKYTITTSRNDASPSNLHRQHSPSSPPLHSSQTLLSAFRERGSHLKQDYRFIATLRAWAAGQPALNKFTPEELARVLQARHGVRTVWLTQRFTSGQRTRYAQRGYDSRVLHSTRRTKAW